MQRIIFYALSVVVLVAIVASCVHAPVPPLDPLDPNNPIDTTNPTTPKDTCHPDTVYFQNDILPLLRSSCAMSGCHDAATASDGVILTDYNNIINTGDVRAGRPDNSDLYEVITETDPDKKMPVPGSGVTLTTEQISMIYTWIMQGAKNNSCDPNIGGCDTMNMSYSADIRPILDLRCAGCHNASSPQGGISLVTHAQVAGMASNGKLYAAINHTGPYPMPKGQSKLDACTIAKFKNWIDDGAPNN